MKKIILPAIALLSIFSFFAPEDPVSASANKIQMEKGKKDTLKETEADYILSRKKLEDEEKFPWFTQNYNNYTPDATAVARLKEEKRHLNFSVWGATWCQDCHNQLPKFYKVMDEAGINNGKILLYGMNREKQTPDFRTSVFPTMQYN